MTKRQQRILFLGGSKFQLPPIKYAKERGHHVITCDFLPENPGHALADEYFNVSTTDIDLVTALAKEQRVDGIVAYASDPAAPTQAHVAHELGLPSNPPGSVDILARKDLFRDFLQEHNFLSPRSRSFSDAESAVDWFEEIKKPVIVKPVDSSGSKGVSKIEDRQQLAGAFEEALKYSRQKLIVVEEFFQREGYQVAGDGFVVDGELAFRCWANEHFDESCNPLVPIGESFPSIMSQYTLDQAHQESQRLLSLLEMSFGALNFDFHYNSEGDFSFLELGPRNGGNLIPEVIRYATGVDLVKYTVDAALGEDCSSLQQKDCDGFYSSYILHSRSDGKIKDIVYKDDIERNIIESTQFVNKGDRVKRFDGSNHTLGTMIMKFDSADEMLHKMDNMNEYIAVVVD